MKLSSRHPCTGSVRFPGLNHRFLRLAILLGAMSGLALSGVAAAPVSADLRATAAWVRWMPAGLPAAGYVRLQNPSSHDLRVTGASSPDYASVELHESITTADGNATMRRIDVLDIPAGARAEFKPGGHHLMLKGARRALQPGDTVMVDFTLADGAHLRVAFAVKPADYPGSAP